MQVSKWGNSLAVRIPTSVVEALGIKEGDDIEVDVVGERRFQIQRTPRTEELLARLRCYRGRLPADFRFDRLSTMRVRYHQSARKNGLISCKRSSRIWPWCISSV